MHCTPVPRVHRAARGLLFWWVLSGAVAMTLPHLLSAQVPTTHPLNPDSSDARPDNAPLPLPTRGGPWVTGINVWAGSAAALRTASHNEKVEGALTMVGVQLTRSLFNVGGVQFSWMVEFLPVMLATVEAPASRTPTAKENSEAFFNPQLFKRYTTHDAFGIGFAPLSAEASRPLTQTLTGVFTVTSGVAYFSAVVPYGKATQANFTVSPALALEWRLSRGTALAAGYTLHHLSNASIGGANPGMNSHVFFARLSRARFPGRGR